MKKVATNTIDAGLLAKMFLAGAKNLEVKKEWINEHVQPFQGNLFRFSARCQR